MIMKNDSNFGKILKQSMIIINFRKRHNKEHQIPGLFEKYDVLLKLINNDKQLENQFTIDDIAYFFRDYWWFYKSIYKATTQEISDELKKYLHSEPKEYFYYFRVDYPYQFALGNRIGNGTIVKFSSLPSSVKKLLEDNFQFEINRGTFSSQTPENYHKLRQDDYYMLIKIKSRGRDNSKQLAIKSLNQNKAIFNFFSLSSFREEYETSTVYVYTDSKDKWLGSSPGHDVEKDPYASSFHVKHIKKINKILEKTETNEIEDNILRAIFTVGTTDSNSNVEIRFLFCMVSIENLLTGNRKDSLRFTLSERLSFLLANNKDWIRYYKNIPVDSEKFKKMTSKFINRYLSESRKTLYYTAQDLYTKRSNIAHLDKFTITEGDYNKAKFLLFSLVLRMLELVDSQITHINNKSRTDKKSVQSVVDEMKFK